MKVAAVVSLNADGHELVPLVYGLWRGWHAVRLAPGHLGLAVEACQGHPTCRAPHSACRAVERERSLVRTRVGPRSVQRRKVDNGVDVRRLPARHADNEQAKTDSAVGVERGRADDGARRSVPHWSSNPSRM
jgi:hypothetical protein